MFKGETTKSYAKYKKYYLNKDQQDNFNKSIKIFQRITIVIRLYTDFHQQFLADWINLNVKPSMNLKE